MASGRCVAVLRLAVVTLAFGLALSGVAGAQESGAQPTSARSAWSRLMGAREYEYDERVDLSLDGSAIVDVNASIPALVALHGAKLDVDPEARLDRPAVRALFEGPGATLTEFSAYRKHGRRFVHARLEAREIRDLSKIVALSWSRYQLVLSGGEYRFVQDVGPPAGTSPGEVGWTGEELVAFRLHLPSKINFHNAPDRVVERGNILAWEQPLRDRIAGMPLHLEARMETQSILYRTLFLFAGSFLVAMTVLGAIVWWILRKGRHRART
jgi:hypothetical protein